MQAINNLWKTTIGKLAIIGGGGIAGLISLCFVCTICGVLVGSDETTQDTSLNPTKVVVKTLPAQIVDVEPPATPTEPLPIDTPTSLPPTETPVPPATAVPPTEIPRTTEVLEPVALAGDSNINLRNGPGTEYEAVGILTSGSSLNIVGRNADSSWWQVSAPEGLAWVAADVVTAKNTSDNIPVVETPLPPTPTESPPVGNPITEASPTEPVATEQLSVETCDCSGDLYNCKRDFESHASAQACYEYCKSIGRGDVHDLDRDGDGTACDPTNW